MKLLNTKEWGECKVEKKANIEKLITASEGR